MELNKKVFWNIARIAIGCILLYWLIGDRSRFDAIANSFERMLSPFIFGAVLAFILNVPMRGFERLLGNVKNSSKRRILASLLVSVSVIVLICIVFILLIPQLSATIQLLIPRLTSFLLDIGKMFNTFLDENPDILKWLMENTDFQSFNWSEIVQKAVTIIGNSLTTILSRALSAIGSLSTLAMDLVIGVAFAIYCLFQKENLARQGRKLLYAFLPEKVADYIVRVMRLANSVFSNFLTGQCLEVVILGLMFAVSMTIFGMPYIPLVSVLIAVTAFIPIVGAWIGCIFGAFLILVANPLQAVWFVVMFLVLQQIENSLIYPRVVGTSIGLPGMWVLLAVSIGGEVMGVIGMFLMIPVVSVLYTLLREETAERLRLREIDSEKLKAHPPEISSHLSFRRKKIKNEKKKMKK